MGSAQATPRQNIGSAQATPRQRPGHAKAAHRPLRRGSAQAMPRQRPGHARPLTGHYAEQPRHAQAHKDQRAHGVRFSTLSRGHVRDLPYSETVAAQHQPIKRLVHDLDTGTWCISSKTPGARLTSVLLVALGERCCGEGRIDAT